MNMAPPSKKTVEDMFASMSAQLDALTTIPADIKRLENLVLELKSENNTIKMELQERDKEIVSLKNHLNTVDQYNRSWSVRIFNITVPENIATNNFKVARLVYDTVILPILQGAVQHGDIPEVPPCDQLIERAHILPGAGGKAGSVIVRFFVRDYRTLLFRFKKDFQPRDPPSPNSKLPGRFRYPIYEDLTKATFSKMRALSAHAKVASAWSTNGVIRYRLEGDSTNAILRVNNVYDPVEKILNC